MPKKTKYPSQAQEQFVVRLPDGMRSRIAKQAEQAGRSMNAEVVKRLQESMQWSGPADRSKVYASGYVAAIVDLLKLEYLPQRFKDLALTMAKRADDFAEVNSEEFAALLNSEVQK